MKELLLIPTITLASYVTYIALKFGIQVDISHSYKVIKQKWLFTIVLWLTAIPIMMVGENGLLFFAGAGICFVGAAPKFWDSMEGKVHVAGALGGIALATIWTFIFSYWWLAFAFTVFALSVEVTIKGKRLIKLKNHTWWVELAAFAMIIIALFLK